MNASRKRAVSLLLAGVVVCVFACATAHAEEGNVKAPTENAPTGVLMTAAEIQAYWTPERMAAAQPYPMPVRELSAGQETSMTSQPQLGEPGRVNGTLPDSMPGAMSTMEPEGISYEPQYSAPGNWSTSYPGPFQRFTWFGRYTTYPTSTIGKIFFSQDHDGNGTASSFVCSGSVIQTPGTQRDLIATAGHCVNNGLNGAGYNSGWSYNITFCPSYNKSGVNPAVGCWSVPTSGLWTKGIWYASGNSEGDIGCMAAANTGTVIANHVGNAVGQLGRAWNYGTQQPEFAFGYPAASPYPGYHIVTCAAPEWYTYSWGTAADCKYIGCDMTGGCSGGPWILGFGHATAEYSDTDSSNSTDPIPGGAGWINGVNSHKIIVGGVTRTQEEGSPQFTDSGDANAENLWSDCATSADGS